MTTDFFRGALTVAFSVAGLFFLRFWRLSGDRLFLSFAAAFWVFAIETVALSLMNPVDETRHYFFALRLIGFGLIIFGVIDKNRFSPPR